MGKTDDGKIHTLAVEEEIQIPSGHTPHQLIYLDNKEYGIVI